VASVTDTFLQRLAASLVSKPFVYDLVQSLAGQEKVAQRLRAVLADMPHRRALDVGSAAGGFAYRLGISPVFADLDPRPVAALRRRRPEVRATVADAATLPFADRTFDLVLCLAVLHHLDDATLERVVSELARVAAARVLILEPLRNDARGISRWLWHYDRGRHPRTRDQLIAALSKSMHVEEAAEFSVYHQYLMCVMRSRGAPRAPRR
jgi:SAM-dependent methyltransferase